jgi:hypothetical protein
MLRMSMAAAAAAAVALHAEDDGMSTFVSCDIGVAC